METVVWRCGSTDAGPNHPRAFKDQRGTDMHGYWVRECDTGATPQSRRAAVIATTVDLTDGCYAALQWTYGLNIVCESN